MHLLVTRAPLDPQRILDQVEDFNRERHGGGGVGGGTSFFGFLDLEGAPVDPGPLDLELVPGCTLVVELTRPDGTPVGGGSFRVQGTYRGDGALALVDGSEVGTLEKAALKAAIEAAKDNPEALALALEKARAALGL